MDTKQQIEKGDKLMLKISYSLASLYRGFCTEVELLVDKMNDL